MAQDTIGYAALQIIPSLQGIRGNLGGNFGPIVEAGRRAGRDAGEAVASGIEAAQASVRAASTKLARARDVEADAAGKIRAAEAKLQDLRDRGASNSQIVAAEERLETARRNGIRATNNTRDAVDELTRARAREANASDEQAESTGRWTGRMRAMDGQIGKSTAALAGMAFAAAGIGEALQQAMGVEVSTDRLQASLGLDPQRAGEVGAIAGDLYAQGWGESMGQVSETVGATYSELRNFELGDAGMEEATRNALAFSEAFGTDVTESVGMVRNLLYQGLAPDATAAFDMITSAYQSVPASMRDELPEIIAEYGTNFRALGFDGQESMFLLASAAGEGKFALDKTGDALKEFTIRASDMSTTSVAAYESLGLNAAEMSSAVAAGGDGAQEALQAVSTALLGVEDPATRANTAIALFGTPIEDLSVDQIPAFLRTLTSIPDTMGSVDGAAADMAATLSGNTAASLETLKRSVETGVIDAMGRAAQIIIENQGAAQVLGGVLLGLGGAYVAIRVGMAAATAGQAAWAGAVWLSNTAVVANTGSLIASSAVWVASRAAMVAGAAATGAVTAAQWLLNAAMSANPIGLVVIALAALVGGLVYAYQNSETFRAIVTAALGAVATAGQWVGDKFVWMADTSLSALGGLRDGAGAVADWIVTKYTGFLEFMLGMPGRISGAAAGMFDGIKNAFRVAINWVISRWNNLSFTLPSIEVFGQRIGGATLSTPDIPMLASGGRAGRRRDGMLWGPGTGISDSILGLNAEGVPTALVSAGEMVVNAQQTAANLPLLQAINNGLTVPRELVGSLAALAGGDYDGRLSRFGVEEDNPLVGALLDTRSGLRSIDGLLGRGDYDGGLSRFGVEEDNPMVAGLLGIRSLLRDGDYTGNLNSAFGIEEDNPLIGALLAVRGRLPRLAGGGVVSAKDLDEFAKGVEGAKYVWGGVNWGDCSGAVSGLVNYAVGEDPWGSRGATGNFREWLAGKGLQPGLGPAGSLNIGWFNGGPYGGHTAATLPNGVNFEMGGARGDGQYGGAAAGASDPDFTDHAHLPPEAFLGGDPDLTGGAGGSPAAPAFSGLGGGGSSPSFTAGGSGGSVGTVGGNFATPEGQVQLADGAAIPVFVVNWPTSGGDMFAADEAATDMTAALDSNTAAIDGAELAGAGDMVNALDSNTDALQNVDMSGQVGGTGVDNQFQGREQEDWGKRVTDAGGNFVKANADQFMSDLGVGQVGGVTGAVINDLVPYLMDLVKNPPQQIISNFHGFDLAESMRRDDVRRKQASLTYQRRGAL